MPFTVSDKTGTLTGERVITSVPHFLNGNLTEVVEMHHGEHTTVARSGTHWSNLLEKELSKFSALMSVEADTSLCHATRLMNRQSYRACDFWMVRYCNSCTVSEIGPLHSDSKSCNSLPKNIYTSVSLPLQYLKPCYGVWVSRTDTDKRTDGIAILVSVRVSLGVYR